MAGGSLNPQYAPLYVAAGKQYGIPPAVLAGVADVETNGGANISVSSAGAIGLMQFLPSTAAGIGVNPMDPKSAIFGAAKLLNQYGYQSNPLRALGAYNGGPGNPQYSYANKVMQQAQRLAPDLKGVSGGLPALPAMGATSAATKASVPQSSTQTTTTTQPNPAIAALSGVLKGSEGLWDTGGKQGSGFGGSSVLAYMPSTVTSSSTRTIAGAQSALQGVAGKTALNTHPALIQKGSQGYVNPIPGATIGRTDMGVDANLPVGHPILAIGDSKVIGISPNWYQGQPYVLMQLTSGPKAGQYWYVAEQIAPSVRPGQTVRAGQQIGTYASSGTGIEIGWGSSTPGRTLAQAQGNTGDATHGNAPAGVAFRSFLGGL
jgi:murein DD-endopeptidase MepM/ murein hydrolase activator NlpD